MLLLWVYFLLCVVAIWSGGARLSRYGDTIAEKTGLGRTWVGVILLATVTSLPEFVTGVSAVTLAGTPDIALGDALGSCVFNLLLITLLDFQQRGESVFTRASQGHILSAGFGVILIGLVGFSVSLQRAWPGLAVGHVGPSTLITLVLYAIAMRTIFRYERRQRAAAIEERTEQYGHVSLRRAIEPLPALALPAEHSRALSVLGMSRGSSEMSRHHHQRAAARRRVRPPRRRAINTGQWA